MARGGNIENFCATRPGRRREAGEKRARAGLEVVSKDRRRTEGRKGGADGPEIGGASSGCV